MSIADRSVRVERAVGLLLAVAVASLELGAVATSARHISCDDVVTRSIKLDSDLNCPRCPSGEDEYGLIVGADDVTIELGYLQSSSELLAKGQRNFRGSSRPPA